MNLYTYQALLIIIQCANTLVNAQDCAIVHNLVLSNSPLLPLSSHSDQPKNATSQRLCDSQTTDCCNSTLIRPIVEGHEIPRAWFDNSIKYKHFTDKLASHILYMKSTGSTNQTLWNATLAGLNVLSNWGVKYWDSHFIRTNVFTNECAAKIAQAAACGICVTGTPVQACKTLCQNIVMGCVKTPLAEYIEGPWKHAVNSVRTAARLIITNNDKQDNTQLNEIVNDLNLWREPIGWWTEENNACDALPESNCWNGDSVGSYEFPVVRWRSSFNPEFDKRGSAVNPNVMIQLDKFHNELIQVRKSLEKYWPTSGSDTRFVNPHMALALSSSEEILEGSGYDDEDMEYTQSGYGEIGESVHKPIDSDDEDLPGYEGSGGSGEIGESPTRQEDTGEEAIVPTESRPPVSLNNGSGMLQFHCCLLTISCVLVRMLGYFFF